MLSEPRAFEVRVGAHQFFVVGHQQLRKMRPGLVGDIPTFWGFLRVHDSDAGKRTSALFQLVYQLDSSWSQLKFLHDSLVASIFPSIEIKNNWSVHECSWKKLRDTWVLRLPICPDRPFPIIVVFVDKVFFLNMMKISFTWLALAWKRGLSHSQIDVSTFGLSWGSVCGRKTSSWQRLGTSKF